MSIKGIINAIQLELKVVRQAYDISNPHNITSCPTTVKPSRCHCGNI